MLYVVRDALSHKRWLSILGTAVAICILYTLPAKASDAGEGVGAVDRSTGIWHLRDPVDGETTSFYYGNPGDLPFAGDWDCDGIDTPGLYRRSDGFVYIRNSNSPGYADRSFFFGNPGDVPLAGDFDGDGCDTVSVYRPAEGRFYIINRLGTEAAGLGAADHSYYFGNPGDKPFVGDFDDDGIDEVGLHRESTGLVYFRLSHTQGVADEQFVYGNPGDVMLAGRWRSKDSSDTVGIFRPGDGSFHLSYENGSGNGDESFIYGNRRTVPIAGEFGPLPGGGSPPALEIHLVSRFTTYHSCCQPRVHNIQTMAREVDGLVVQPGHVFDLNERIGPRTEAKGYVPAPILLDGEGYCCDHPLNIGGGTSQFGTTIYAAIFFGGYVDIDHKPHSRYIDRYPLGIEATLGYPSPNVVFRNDTDFPVTVRTGYTSTSITVELWGNNHGRTMVGSHANGTTSTWITRSGDAEARKVTYSVSGSATYSDGGFVVVRRWLTEGGESTSRTWTHQYISD
jgi:hypothetical protein